MSPPTDARSLSARLLAARRSIHGIITKPKAEVHASEIPALLEDAATLLDQYVLPESHLDYIQRIERGLENLGHALAAEENDKELREVEQIRAAVAFVRGRWEVRMAPDEPRPEDPA